MTPPNDRKRKMNPLISGDNTKAHAVSQEGCCSQAKTACMARPASGSPSGDSQVLGHDYVTVLRDLEDESSAPVIHSHSCDLEDVWAHKYPLPLGTYPSKTIKTGYKHHDAIIPDLPTVGYKPLQVLSKGTSGSVLLAQDVRPGVSLREMECQPVVLKLIKQQTKHDGAPVPENDSTDEVLIHKRLQHHNVVSFINTVAYQGRVGIVMELCECGTLEGVLRAHDARFVHECIARRYLHQLHSAVEYLHLSGVAHRNLCPGNVLVSTDNSVKLCDMSQAVMYSPGDDLPEDMAGTPGYQAPEMLLRQPYDPRRVDLWSLGCLLYHMVAGSLPYGKLKTEEEARAMKPLSFPETRILVLSQQVKDLLSGMLAYVPSSRYSLNRVRNSEWYQTQSDKVQLGNFYLVRQPQKVSDGDKEREVKAEYEI